MNKLYQRINWQNYPSDSTPLNENNLNKMDAAVDGIDDRVVTLDVTKLPVSTANTMVKDVTFNETTGVFTITKLNGTKVTVNTALEKIATNFRFDHSTQKLILTLIDGTTQEVDLSALLTQYEFLNSSTIQFTIDSSGKVKASVVNGSITGDMLEPNYLANVTLQASKADTSAKNAKESEEKAAEYAESAKNSADSAEPVASTATGTNPTAQDSTNAPLIYGKFKGYTEQQTYSGKNKSSAGNLTGTLDAFIPINHLVDGTTYTLSCVLSSTDTDSSSCVIYKRGSSGEKFLTNGIRNTRMSLNFTKESGDTNIRIFAGSNYDFSIGDTVTISDIQIEEGTTATDFEIFVGGTASPNPDYPQEINGLAKDGAIEVKTCGKNLSSAGNLTGTLDAFIPINHLVDGTTYTLSCVLSSTDTDSSSCVIYKRGSSGEKFLTNGIRNTRMSLNFTKESGDTNIRIFAGSNYDFSIGDTVTISDIQIEEGTTATPYEPYTETTAAIPTDAPLYEGDYLEVYADGSGKLVRDKYELTVTSDVIEMGHEKNYVGIYLPLVGIGSGNYVVEENMHSTHFTGGTRDGIYYGSEKQKAAINSTGARILASIEGYTTLEEYKAFFDSEECKFVYKLATPTETPLTTEQVAQFKKLYTFECVTNVLCDGEVEMLYLKNTNGGKALASVRRGVECADTATTATTATKATQDGNGNVIAETYYRKANFDKIVGGTVEPSGMTNVQYSVPTAMNGNAVIIESTTDGNLVNALNTSTARISAFFSTFYDAVKTRYLGRIDLGMYAIQDTYDFTSFAGYDRYTLVFKGKDANRSLFTRELLTIHNIEKNTSNVGKACLNISNNYTFEPWVEMYQSGDKTYIVVQLTDTTGLTTLVSSLYVEVYGAMD